MAPVRGKAFIHLQDADGQADLHQICLRLLKGSPFLCISKGFAPALIRFDCLPGGWHVVVMDAINEDYAELNTQLLTPLIVDGIEAKIIELHQQGFVHGDIQDTNVLVRKDRMKGFMLVDFDWAGEIGDVQYPMNVNWGDDLWQPEGARDGKLILPDHDLEMLRHMLNTWLMLTL